MTRLDVAAPPCPRGAAARKRVATIVSGATAWTTARIATRPRRPEPPPSGSSWGGVHVRIVDREADQFSRSRVELFGTERLGQEVVRAERHGARVLLFLAGRRQDDARDFLPPR